MDLVIPLDVREAFKYKAYWVKQAIILVLREDGTCGEVRSIALQVKLP